MVKLGARTDLLPDRTAVSQWCGAFSMMYQTLQSCLDAADYHRKRVRTIERRLNDAELMRDYPEGSQERTEAYAMLDRQRDALERREQVIGDIAWQFPSFWKARPDGVGEWLRTVWFAYANEPDRVCVRMHDRGIDSSWKEVQDQWERRDVPVNMEPCPF